MCLESDVLDSRVRSKDLRGCDSKCLATQYFFSGDMSNIRTAEEKTIDFASSCDARARLCDADQKLKDMTIVQGTANQPSLTRSYRKGRAGTR